MDIRFDDALSRACSILAQSNDALLACNSVFETFENLFNYQRSCVVLLRPSDGRPMVFTHSLVGIPADQRPGELHRVNEILASQRGGVIRRVIETGESIILPDTRNCEFYVEGESTSQAEACAPLTVAGRTFGALNVESRYRGRIAAQDGLLLRCVANQIALMIERMRLLHLFEETNTVQVCSTMQAKSGVARAVPGLLADQSA